MVSSVGTTAIGSMTPRMPRVDDVTSGPTPPKDRDPREVFDTFFGETFYGQMLKSLRSTAHKPAYFHGGRAEEIFQGQLDQMLAQELTRSDASQMTDAMFQAFMTHANRS